ncbi:TonB-dependent receptor [Olivibacter sp. SDN3]|uniref:outer membrane beta-barrel protein n=1 Tax=Olivibacter sp. SDN3 TaxID=2764720 RepID=UPI0016514AD2|nr:outer membrane beta-barrel protein [Olivibacter sp. SDN3]QNL48067.1 TonB-dependent receptor [Olivibacter sp. SDN3]
MHNILIKAIAVTGLLWHTFALNAQESNGKIQGRVLDNKSNPLISASIVLVREADSSAVRTVATDGQGRYRFDKIEPGDYRVAVSYLGNERYISGLLRLEAGAAMPVPDIEVVESATVLEEVSIVQTEPYITQKIDRTVVNVEALISNAGTTALDVLERTPGVRVDPNGTINLGGKVGVMVYVDERPTYMSGEELANFLRSMPASSLEKIEVMTNPPANYDAAGDAGILNILTKKARGEGFTAGLELGLVQHRHTASNNSLNFSFSGNRFRMHGNVGYVVQNGFADVSISRRFLEGKTVTSSFNQFSAIRRPGRGLLSTVNAEYSITERSTLGIVLGGTFARPDRENPNQNTITDGDGMLDSTLVAENSEKGSLDNMSVNLNYRRKFDKDRHDFAVDADYLNFHINRDQWFNNSGIQNDGQLTFFEQLSGQLGANIDIYAAKADYRYPLAENFLLALGVKSSFTKTVNIADYFFVEDGIYEPDFDKTNSFNYQENINAAYVNMNADYERLSIQLGLRVENTLASGHQLGNAMRSDSSFNRNYTGLFPTVFMLYKLDSLAERQLRFSYGRRLERPYYQDLNPFLTPIDHFTYTVGNPYLEPSFSNKVELSYIYKGMITTSIGYSDTRNLVTETIEIVDETYYSRPNNIGRTIVWNAAVDAGFSPAPWLDVQLRGEVARLHAKGSFYTGVLDNTGYNGYLQGMVGVGLGKGWRIQTDGHYQTDITQAQFVYGSKWGLNAGVSKKLSERASFRLGVSDIFYTNINRGIINDLRNTQAEYRNIGDSRRVQAAFSYRFGKSGVYRPSREDDSAGEERNRVKL